MTIPENSLKSALGAGRVQKGIWLNLGSAIAAEIAGHAGFDRAVIDGEHAPHDVAAIRDQLIALAGTGTAPVLRVPTGRDWVLKQALDMGVQTVLVPMVDNADQARALVRALRYPPEGMRGMGAGVARASGFGAIADYADSANDRICLLVQAESRAALENLPAICAVDGVDGVFIGPADLAADMGHRSDPDHPEVTAAIEAAIATVTGAGKPAGIIAFSAPARARYLDLGVTFLGMGSEAALLAGALRGLAARG